MAKIENIRPVFNDFQERQGVYSSLRECTNDEGECHFVRVSRLVLRVMRDEK